ncbi:hypothetical protein [uncultured Anaerococcus sp.]|uniref:hypothetical protein n=1 Tax=uncultured Anaerococcus sp. TaxID=293428 RepID=UPI002612085E|nr:hypothetical protein [uncultured Anaerococcus sp.]
MKKNEKKVYESNNEVVDNNISEDVPMSNGENCGIVEFEGKRINTCKGEKIVEKGYKNPDKEV